MVKLVTIDPSSLRADARRNYDRLLQSAETLFLAQGALASLESIAKQAGVGIGTLYRHFPTRKVLLEAVYADNVTELVKRARLLLVAASPDKALTSWLQSVVELASKQDGFGDLMRLSAEDRTSSLITTGAKLLERAQTTGSLRKDITIYDLLQLVNGVVANGATAIDAARAEKLLSIVVAGLKTPA